MKKTVFYFVLIVVIALSLSSCLFLIPSTHKLVVDKNVPGDQNVLVTFVNSTKNGWFILKEWNNKNIVDELYGKKSIASNDKAKLTVPAGNTSFSFTVRFSISTGQYSSTTYTFDDIELRYNMEPGKEYQINGTAKSKGLFKGFEFFVEIYDVTGKSTLLREWKLGES